MGESEGQKALHGEEVDVGASHERTYGLGEDFEDPGNADGYDRAVRWMANRPWITLVGLERIAVHLHDCYGAGLANALMAFQAGARTFDSTVGGVGGNRLLENAVGNIATEELVHLFHDMGVSTGVDFDALLDAGRTLLDLVRRAGDPPPPSKILAYLDS